MVSPNERSCFTGLSEKEAIRELQKHKTDSSYWQDYEFEWVAIMISVLVTQKVADWNFHKYVGFFHNYLFDMLEEYLATGNIDYAKYREKYYQEAEIERIQKLSLQVGQIINNYEILERLSLEMEQL